MHVEGSTVAPPCLRDAHREHCLYIGRLTLAPKPCPTCKRRERSKPRKAIVQTKAEGTDQWGKQLPHKCVSWILEPLKLPKSQLSHKDAKTGSLGSVG